MPVELQLKLTMNRNKIIFLRIFLLIQILMITGCKNQGVKDRINVLILSGKNNHEWQKTTPLLANVLRNANLFSINVTESPDTLTYNNLRNYDVLISNWNSWPDNEFRMTKEWEDDLFEYVNNGGGILFFHAGASSFYNWAEYHQMGIGRWGNNTSHGKQTTGKVCEFDQNHPITKGLRDFLIVDEIWEKTDIYSGVQAIAMVTATDETDGHLIREPAVFVNNIGKGRTFFTILGHDERALLNSGLQTILLRAAEWCAGRKVTIEPPAEMIMRKDRDRTPIESEILQLKYRILILSDETWKNELQTKFKDYLSDGSQ